MCPRNKVPVVSKQKSYDTSSLLSILKFQENVELPVYAGHNIDDFLYERYLNGSNGLMRNIYYTIKPGLPRFVQLSLRRMYASSRSHDKFPRWPIEPVVVDTVKSYLLSVVESLEEKTIHRVSYWPEKKKFAFCITHDVEWDDGLRRAPQLAAIEREYGFVSSWNIVPERYPIDWKIIDRLRQEGAEIGVHGFSHDGKLFQSKKIFTKRAKKINEYAKQWGASGFRSESTLRNVEWMPALELEYDTSFPDTDPYEPQPGGCCTIWPYFIGRLVELPLTLPQDHTVFEILGLSDIEYWKLKANWIAENGGLVLINVHPDYMQTTDRLKLYEKFLSFMKNFEGMWHTQPVNVAKWWRERAKLRFTVKNNIPSFFGTIVNEANVVRTTLRNGEIFQKIL